LIIYSFTECILNTSLHSVLNISKISDLLDTSLLKYIAALSSTDMKRW